MNKFPEKSFKGSEKNQKNLLAPNPDSVLAFRKYTQDVWSRVAERPISEEEADQIIEDFGSFLRALASGKMENNYEKK